MELLYTELEKLSYNVKINDLKNNFKLMHDGYTKNAGIGQKYIDSYQDALCYAFFRMASTTAVIKKCLSYIPECDEKLSLLDLGAGTGASIFACLMQEKLTFSNLNCVESSENMLKVLKKLVSDISLDFELKCVKKDVIKDDIGENKPDVVLASFSMNEMNKADRIKLLNKMWLLSNKYILIIEPGTPTAHKEMMEYKEYLISLGGKVIAPCMNDQCPILKDRNDDWCHFQVRLQRPTVEVKIKESDRNFEDEKFTFLLIEKGDNFENFNSNGSIIIRRPILRKGKTILSVCSKNNTIEQKVITKKDGELYKKAKKLSVGDYL